MIRDAMGSGYCYKTPVTIKKHPLLKNLRKSRTPLAALIHVLMDDILERPVGELFSTAELSGTIAVGIRSIAAEPRNEHFLERQIYVSIADLQDAKFKGKLPNRMIKAIRSLAAQPFVLDEDLITELLDHDAARILLREVLQLSMLSFSEQLANLVPGGNVISEFVSKVRGIAALTIGSDGMSVEEHINESVEKTLSPALRMTAERLADDSFTAELADWRGHVLNVLLDQPVKELIGHLDQVAPKELASQLATLLQSIAEWSKLEEIIEKSVGVALDRAGDQSLRNIMYGASAEKDLRPVVEQQLVEAIWPFVQSSAFEEWLNEFS
jgi:hypothetical protein